METTINQKVDLSTLTHETEKIPDFILLKLSRQEVGKLEAEIDYLNAENADLRKKIVELEKKRQFIGSLSRDEIKALKKDEIFNGLRKEVSIAQKKINELRKSNDELICKLAQQNKS